MRTSAFVSREMVECFSYLSTSDCRSIVLSGSGKSFTSGLDIMDHADVFASAEDEDVARKAFRFREFIKSYQLSFTSVEKVGFLSPGEDKPLGRRGKSFLIV